MPRSESAGGFRGVAEMELGRGVTGRRSLFPLLCLKSFLRRKWKQWGVKTLDLLQEKATNSLLPQSFALARAECGQMFLSE